MRDCYNLTRTHQRPGVTLIELLTALSLVSCLLAMLLPAVQSARESARKVQCLNHLRQIGIASHNHVSLHGSFPYTSSGPRSIGTANSPDVPVELAASPHAFLLATIDPPTYHQIDFTDPYLTDLSTRMGSVREPNQRLLRLTIPVFRCPSDRHATGANNYRANLGTTPKPHPRYINLIPQEQRGAFDFAGSVKPSEFGDGLSNTALFSEKVIGDFDIDRFNPFTDRFDWVNDIPFTENEIVRHCENHAPANHRHHSYSGSNWLVGGLNATWYNHLLAPNHLTPDCSGGAPSAGGARGIYSARSYHPGGANTVFADGSAKTISQTIELVVWRAMGTRNGSD